MVYRLKKMVVMFDEYFYYSLFILAGLYFVVEPSHGVAHDCTYMDFFAFAFTNI